MPTLADSGSCDSKVMAFGRMAPLEGKKLVQMVYMDEGGISQHEPVVVVSGVMIDGDRDLVNVEQHLQRLVEIHIPKKDREGFAFHAKNIFSGTGYFKDRDRWPLEKRLAILDDLVAIPSKFDLHVAFGSLRKQDYDLGKFAKDQEQLDAIFHSFAFARCTGMIELIMRHGFPDENALLIAENNNSSRSMIKSVHAIFRDDESVKRMGLKDDHLPLTRIRDTVHFADKQECRHLQLADVCAFVLRGYLTRHPHNPRFFDALRPALYCAPPEKSRV